MTAVQGSRFGKWAGLWPDWFVFASGPLDDCQTGGNLGDGEPYYRLTKGWRF